MLLVHRFYTYYTTGLVLLSSTWWCCSASYQNKYCSSAVSSYQGLEACEYDYRTRLIQACPGTAINNYLNVQQYQTWDYDDGKFGNAFLKMFGKSQVDPQAVEYFMSQPASSWAKPLEFFSDVWISVRQMFLWCMWAAVTLAVAILVLIVVLAVVCPMYCCKCCRTSCGCCDPGGCCAPCCPKCCSRSFLRSSRIEKPLAAVLTLLVVLLTTAAIVFSSFAYSDTMDVECAITTAVYQTSYGSFKQNELGSPSFGGIAELDKFVHGYSTEVDVALAAVTAWNNVVESMYVGALGSLYAPVRWTSNNMQNRTFNAWRSPDGSFPSHTLGHVVMADQVFFGSGNKVPGLFDFQTAYAQYLEAGSVASSAFKLPTETLHSLVDTLSGESQALKQLIATINFPDIYKFWSSLLSGFDDAYRVMIEDGNSVYVKVGFSLLIVASCLPILSIFCGIAAFYVHRFNCRQMKRRARASGLRPDSTGMLGFGSCWFLVLGFLYLVFSGIGISAIVFVGDGCQFMEKDLFTEDKYSQYPILSEYIPETLSNHCMTYDADGNTMAGFGAESVLDEAADAVESIVTSIKQIPLSTLFPEDIQSALQVNIPQSVIDVVKNESDLYQQVVPDFTSPSPSVLMTSAKILFAGIGYNTIEMSDDTVTGRTLGQLVKMPVFNGANYPSFKDFPWRENATAPIVIGPYSDTQVGLRDLLRQSSLCSSFADNICTHVASQDCGSSDIIINRDHVFYIDPKYFESETSINEMPLNFVAQDPQSQPLFSCIANETPRFKLLFMVGVYQTVMKAMLLSRLPSTSAIIEHAPPASPYVDLCPLDTECYQFISMHRSLDGNVSLVPSVPTTWASELKSNLQFATSQTTFQSIADYLIQSVAMYNPLPRLGLTAKLINPSYNCKTLFDENVQVYTGGCRKMGGDFSVMCFTWWLLGIIHVIIGFILFSWFKGQKLLIDSPPVDVSDAAFLRAALNADKEELRQYVKLFPPNSVFDDRYNTPLHYTAYKGSISCCELLVASGHNINDKNLYGYTPLDVAIVEGHERVVAFLMSKGGMSLTEAKGPSDGPHLHEI